jgi:RND family efflux transporter MFP subunit
MRRPSRKVWLPFAVLAGSLVLVAAVIATRPMPPTEEVAVLLPVVRVTTAVPGSHRFVVRAQGTVMPRTESDLVAQLAGEVVGISPALVSGGFFEKGDVLVRLDAADARANLESARAALARTRSEARRARKELERQRALASASIASEQRIDDTENNLSVAEALLREAQARFSMAERDLTRTELIAPYAGRVRSKHVDVGQFVSRGARLASLYAVDQAEVRLPVPDRELHYVDVPLAYRPREEAAPSGSGEDAPLASAEAAAVAAREAEGPTVVLRAEFAGQQLAWNGHIVRTEGEIDPKSRMVTLVARVDDPYNLLEEPDPQRPPLAVGLFVRAEIAGREVDDIVVLPRAALSAGRLLLIDENDRVRFLHPSVLREERDDVILSGVPAGARISVTPLPEAIEGMQVRPVEAPTGGASDRPVAKVAP